MEEFSMKIQIFCDGPFCFCPMSAETDEMLTQDAFEDAYELRAWAKACGHEIVPSPWFRG